ncbi:7tm 6 domain containing protein, partial [Asbolus verrucosus]
MERYDWKRTISVNILILKVLGLWPGGDETYKPNFYMLWSIFSITLFTIGHPFFQTINIIFIFDDFEAVIATIYVTFSEFLIILKAYLTIKNMKILKQLMVTLDSDLFQPRNAEQIILFEPGLKFWKINISVFWTMALGTIFFWSTYPIFDKSVHERRLPFLAWYPFNTKISPYYEITYAYQVIGVTFSASTALSVAALITAYYMYIAAQFVILSDDVRHLYDKSNNSINFKMKLINCVTHHRTILKFAEESSKFSNWIIFGQFFSSAATLALTMFQLTTVAAFSSEFFSLMGFLASITLEIFMYCWFGNEVEIESSKVAYTAFESNWMDRTTDLKNDIIFFVRRCQKPLKMSALQLFYLSLETFMKVSSTYLAISSMKSLNIKLQILRASYSYFALLH